MVYDGSYQYRLTSQEKKWLESLKPKRGRLTVKVVYPVRGSRSLYYKTEMIARDEIEKYREKYPEMVIVEG